MEKERRSPAVRLYKQSSLGRIYAEGQAMNPTNPQPKTTRHFLNEAYEYGFEADEFDPDLANAALNEIDSRLHKLIAQAKREAAIAELEAFIKEYPWHYGAVNTTEVDYIKHRLAALKREAGESDAA
jgi:hypothetical protein